MFKKRQLKPAKLHKRIKFRQPLNKKRILKIALFIILVIFVLLVIILFKSNPFQIKKLKFLSSSFCATNSDIEKIIAPAKQNFFIPDFSGTEKAIMEHYSCLKSVSIKKVFPNTLTILMTPRQPAVVIDTYITDLAFHFKQLEASTSTQTAQPTDLSPNINQATQSGTFVSDAGDIIFSTPIDPNLPSFNLFDHEISLGQKLDDDLAGKSLEIIQNLQKMGISYQAINIRDTTVYIDSQPSINLSLSKDLSRQLVTLQLILQKAKIESKQVQKIDLRFDKAVVVYSVRKS